MDTIGRVFYGTGIKAKIMRAWRRWLFNRLEAHAGYCTGGGCTGECPHGALDAARQEYKREELI